MAPRIQVVVQHAPAALEMRSRWTGSLDHFSLIYRDHEIGRTYLTHDAEPARWHWYLIVPMAVPDWAQGMCGDLAAAKTRIEAAWGHLLRTTDRARLQRA